jgi:hypothetical protein
MPIPEKLQGFELEDDDKMKMCELWPEGEDVALKVSFSLVTRDSEVICLHF